MEYIIYFATGIAIYTIISLGYAVAFGYAGIINFGHVGIVAAGAYAAAILASQGVAFPAAIAAAGLAGTLVGFLLSLPSDRIRSDYYALVTLGFLFIVNSLALNLTWLTGGPFGIAGIKRPAGFDDGYGFFVLSLAVAAAVGLAIYRVLHTPFGTALEAVRDDAELAASLGKPTKKLRTIAMLLSGGAAGIGGGMLAYFLQFINPQLFWTDMAVMLVSILVVGGMASFKGTIMGAAIVMLLTEPFRFIAMPSGMTGPLRAMLYSLAVVIVVIYRPKGVMGRAYIDS